MSACAIADGLDIDEFAPRLSFFFGIGMNLFMEVAKLRAARTLWARIMTDLGAKTEKSKLLRTHCQTSGVCLTEQDPYNNIVRTTVEALAAVLGGTQSLHTNSFDEAIALPTDFSARIARNTQLILAEESGVTAVADPLGGIYYVEALTRELEEQRLGADRGGRGAWRHDQGGRRGPAQDADRGSRRGARGQGRHGRDGDRRRQPLPARRKRSIDILEVDNAKVRAGQIARLEKMRGGRDEAKVRAALDALRRRARASDAQLCWRCGRGGARARCSLGEISRRAGAGVRALSHHAGAGQRHLRPAQRRRAGRKRSRGRRAVAERLGRKPRILVAKMGQDGHDRGANLVASAFGDLGFEVIAGPLVPDPARERPSWRSRRTSTWSARRASRRGTRR